MKSSPLHLKDAILKSNLVLISGSGSRRLNETESFDPKMFVSSSSFYNVTALAKDAILFVFTGVLLCDSSETRCV